MGLPETIFVRRKDILVAFGLSEYEFRQVIHAGLIHPVRIGKKRNIVRGKYLRAEIEKVFLKGTMK